MVKKKLQNTQEYTRGESVLFILLNESYLAFCYAS